MINKPIIIFLIIVSAISYDCCTRQKGKNDMQSRVKSTAIDDVKIINPKDNTKNVNLSIGQNIIVRLDANPSTGYRWEIVDNDEDLLPLISRDYQQREAAPGMVGVGGIESLTFKAIKKGQLTLKLQYTRAMPNPDDTVEQYEMKVIIE
jgi:predicted secreted protein